MSKTTVVTARIGQDTLTLLDRIADAQGRSRAWVIAQALDKQAKVEAEFLDFLQEGVDDLDAGRVIDHQELVDRLKTRRAKRQAA